MSNDTIVAVATPHGVGGIAVVRLSGPDALPIATKHLKLSTFNSLLRPANLMSELSTLNSPLPPRRATYCRFDDLDDIVAVYYPKGYTGEPTVELSCHGSTYIQQTMLRMLVDDGARLAEPGEYTMRAFLNGRLDLSQAEAVADLIDAATPQQHRLAVSQLRGGYAAQLKALRQQLLDLTSLLELELDFSQEDVEFADRSQLRQVLERLTADIGRLTSSFALGNALKRGIPVAIVGKPNVGKSTLLNALLHDERAIVSPVPGTTRDTIEELLTLEGITFRLVDTAGLRHTDDTVEQLGIARSRKALNEAMIVIHLVSAEEPEYTGSQESLETLDCQDSPEGQKHIMVMNKVDLCDCRAEGYIAISAKTGEGLEQLKEALVKAAGGRHQEETLLANSRHYEALLRVQQALQHVAEGLDNGLPADLTAIDLRDALYHLGTVTGEVTSDEVLGNIFSRFCIGK